MNIHYRYLPYTLYRKVFTLHTLVYGSRTFSRFVFCCFLVHDHIVYLSPLLYTEFIVLLSSTILVCPVDLMSKELLVFTLTTQQTILTPLYTTTTHFAILNETSVTSVIHTISVFFLLFYDLILFHILFFPTFYFYFPPVSSVYTMCTSHFLQQLLLRWRRRRWCWCWWLRCARWWWCYVILFFGDEENDNNLAQSSFPRCI